ncbi:hypothetical protein BDV25DRAFT_139388 [Aspergillus avenaceus]|uniref:Uncharacterized protein n=1 Tax=Aspergillus avenaceus TaxID=36643 RepID=A0A5N6TXR9_ASPAV|nr:hypothetical protein BDV25DRAFT_139388 [Aspergillus avenaceus]
MRLNHLFLTLGSAVTAYANCDPDCCAAFSYVQVVDKYGQAHCCPPGWTHSGTACTLCEDPTQYYDAHEKKCKSSSCVGDKVLFLPEGKCDLPSVCGPHKYYNNWKCEPLPDCSSWPGTHYEHPTGCVRDNCNVAGQIWINGGCAYKASCHEDEGEVYDPWTNTCKKIEDCHSDKLYWTPTGCKEKPICTDPTHYFRDGMCGPCKDPSTMWNGKECEKKKDCDLTQNYWRGRDCVPIPHCAKDQYWDVAFKACKEIQNCPKGQVWNMLDSCVDVPYRPGRPICFTWCNGAESGTCVNCDPAPLSR